MIDAKTAAAKLGRHVNWIYRYAEKLGGYKLGPRDWRFPDNVEELCQNAFRTQRGSGQVAIPTISESEIHAQYLAALAITKKPANSKPKRRPSTIAG